MSVKSSLSRNNVFMGLVVIIIVSTVIAAILGSAQDKVFLEDYRTYKIVDMLMKDGSYSQAEPMFNKLLSSHPDSYYLLWRYAVCLAAQGKFSEAEENFMKARTQRPILLMNQEFLLQNGETLYRLGRYERAEKYLSKGIQLNTNAKLSKLYAPLLSDTKEKLQRK